MPELDADSLLCAGCIEADAFLATLIEEDGTVMVCPGCGERAPTMSIAEIGDLVHGVFKKYAVRAEDSYEIGENGSYPIDGGVLPMDTLQEELGFPFEVAEALLTYLAQTYQRDQNHDPGDDWYDETSEATELRAPASTNATDEWNIFVEQVRHHGRFFNEAARQYLNALFDPLLRGDHHDGTPPLVTLGGADSIITHVYRGRAANTTAEQRAIYANVRRELAAPPKRLRRANRMNAEGVAAFYGALDVETCVAELRPAVHGYVIVGKFTFVRPVRVLDMRLVDNAIAKNSWFDAAFPEKVAAGRFMRSLHDIIRVPVFPGAESLDYVPTQVISDYLASKGIEGMLYVSSLVDREQPDVDGRYIRRREIDQKGVNVVLFSRAAMVIGELGDDEYDIVRVDLPWSADDPLPNNQYVERKAHTPNPDVEFEYPLVEDALEPTLQLAQEDVSITEVRGIAYTIIKHEISYIEKDGPADTDGASPF